MLEIEIISGPQDGTIIILTEEDHTTLWTKDIGSKLSFPWDTELGSPQAIIRHKGDEWEIEAYDSPHGLYVMNGDGKLLGIKKIKKGQIYRANYTWLKMKNIQHE